MMVELTHSPIDVASVLRHLSHPDAGGEVLFVGTTRRWTHVPAEAGASSATDLAAGTRLETKYLVYEAYQEMAVAQLQRLVDEAGRRWPLCRAAVVHRLGKVLPEEASIVVAVSCPHRAEAFEAARWLIDAIKRDVPIWKREHYADSSPRWIHEAGSCCQPPDPSAPSSPSRPELNARSG